jgi:hypothetical protein
MTTTAAVTSRYTHQNLLQWPFDDLDLIPESVNPVVSDILGDVGGLATFPKIVPLVVRERLLSGPRLDQACQVSERETACTRELPE